MMPSLQLFGMQNVWWLLKVLFDSLIHLLFKLLSGHQLFFAFLQLGYQENTWWPLNIFKITAEMPLKKMPNYC
jgi:hypothetical protein